MSQIRVFHVLHSFSEALTLFADKQNKGTVTLMLGTLWKDNRGHISEYALILSLILVLGIGLISQTGTALRNLYGRVSTPQATSSNAADKKK